MCVLAWKSRVISWLLLWDLLISDDTFTIPVYLYLNAGDEGSVLSYFHTLSSRQVQLFSTWVTQKSIKVQTCFKGPGPVLHRELELCTYVCKLASKAEG